MYIKTNLNFSDFQAMETIERQYYPPEYIAPAETSYSWYLHWPDSILAVFEDDKPVGFMNLFPVHDGLYQQIQSGTFNDALLKVEDIRVPVPSATGSDHPYALFLSCVAVDRNYLKKGIARTLLKAYLERYTMYEKEGYAFGDLITDNVTEAGLQFSKSIGLTPLRQSDHQSWICTGTFNSLRRSLSND